jgi:aspartate racemase
MTKTIGILGGMGPEATVYFYDRLIRKTKASKDQEHIPVIIYSDPRVPPRTDAILKTGPSPVPFLVEGAKMLILAGADFLVMPCITAHYFWPEVAPVLEFPFIHLVDEASSWAAAQIPRAKKIGLIASSGTVDSGLFHSAFAQNDMEILTPPAEQQAAVMACIFGPRGIKAGYKEGESREEIIRVAKALLECGAQAVIAGCTEVPLALRPEDIPVPLIEPMAIGVEHCIIKAGYKIRD